MTANDTNRVESDNSDSRTAERIESHSTHDTQHTRIVAETRAVGGTTTRRDLLVKTELTSETLGERLGELADWGYLDLIGDSGHELIVLTHRGKNLAEEIR